MLKISHTELTGHGEVRPTFTSEHFILNGLILMKENLKPMFIVVTF